MFSYVAYGLGIHSALALPELVAEEATADVFIRLGNVNGPLPSNGTARFWATPNEACHAVGGVGAFLVRGGREVVVEPAPDVEERVLRLSILGPALALALHQLGRFVLHASAVEVADGVIAFMGGSGWGKSTLAAALHARGFGLVADDVTAIDLDTDGPTVLPGFPQLKLWPEAVVSLGELPDSLPRLHPRSEKRARRITRGFSQRRLPLKGLYVLGEGPTPAIESLGRQEGLLEIVRHWYGGRFGHPLLQPTAIAASHFRRCARLASAVPIRRLKRTPAHLPVSELASLVEDDLARIR